MAVAGGPNDTAAPGLTRLLSELYLWSRWACRERPCGRSDVWAEVGTVHRREAGPFVGRSRVRMSLTRGSTSCCVALPPPPPGCGQQGPRSGSWSASSACGQCLLRASASPSVTWVLLSVELCWGSRPALSTEF